MADAQSAESWNEHAGQAKRTMLLCGHSARDEALDGRLREAGLTVRSVDSPAELERALADDPLLSIVVIDGTEGCAPGGELLEVCQVNQPGMPIIWLTDGNLTTAPVTDGRMPDAVMHYDTTSEDIKATASRLMRNSLYPSSVVELVSECVKETIGDDLQVVSIFVEKHATSSGVRLAPTGATLSFSGPVIAGSIAISADDKILSRIRGLDADDSSADCELADFAGEIGNLVLGRFKRGLDNRGIDIVLGAPSPHSDSHGERTDDGPAIVMQFDAGGEPIYARLAIKGLDKKKIAAAPLTVPEPDESIDDIQFL